VTVTVPPNRELVLRIQLVRRLPDPGPLPDLAVAEPKREGNTLRVAVYNFGSAPSAETRAILVDSMGRTVSEAMTPRLDSARDFFPKKAEITFPTRGQKNLSVMIDPDNAIREIVKTNNTCAVPER
jgi:subtilase family serine protease